MISTCKGNGGRLCLDATRHRVQTTMVDINPVFLTNCNKSSMNRIVLNASRDPQQPSRPIHDVLLSAPSFSIPSQPTTLPATSSAFPPPAAWRCSPAAFISSRPADFCWAPESFQSALPVAWPMVSWMRVRCHSSDAMGLLNREMCRGVFCLVWRGLTVFRMEGCVR